MSRNFIKSCIIAALATMFLLAGCGYLKISKPILKMMVSSWSKPSADLFYADSCDKRIGIPYVENGDPAQVLDIYYADKAVRKVNARMIEFMNSFLQ